MRISEKEVKKIKEALYKRAIRYEVQETKEYIQKKSTGEEVKKIERTTRHIPPDTKACAMLLDDDEWGNW